MFLKQGKPEMDDFEYFLYLFLNGRVRIDASFFYMLPVGRTVKIKSRIRFLFLKNYLFFVSR